MRPLISFRPGNKNDHFEGARMRKTIKGALELNDQKYANNYVDIYDIAHFMCVEEETKLLEAEYRGVPIIISSLYTEDDKAASFLEYKKIKNKDEEQTLKPRAIKILNRADLVLVPSESAKKLLIANGVTSNIEILLPGVNFARFNFFRKDEKELFYRYFKEDKKKPLIISIGEYVSKENISSFIKIAKENQDATFYYFGLDKSKIVFDFKLKRMIRNAPRNVHIIPLVPEDIYRSALMNASIFLVSGYRKSGVISIQDAIAAKCQLIVRKQAVFEDMLVNRETAYIGEFSETLSELVKDYLQGKIKPTTEKAYMELSSCSLREYGEKLIHIYQREIEKKRTKGGLQDD